MIEVRNTRRNTGVMPRVFISYAPEDGEQFATQLRQRLEAEHIPLWQYSLGMEGGKDWWQQITEAIDHVEFMVLVMTPAAMQSPMVRKEWQYARQQGVCVYPVKGIATLDFYSLPHWMRSAHFYDLDREWVKFLNDLSTRCEHMRVPFMVEDLSADFLPRPQEFEALIDKFLDQRREEPVAITAALCGARGYGKTTMAIALCHDERIQEAFDDGILWVSLGENPGNLVGRVEDLIYMLTLERPGFMGIDAATARLTELLANRDILLVIDDVWNVTHLKPFIQGGKRCARLITTRNEDVLPTNTQRLVLGSFIPSATSNTSITRNINLQSTRPLRIFICHSSGDKPQVRNLYKQLIAVGIDAWLDEESLLAGQDWELEISRAISNTDVVIVCLSKNSTTKSGYVQKEIKFALDEADRQPEGTIFIIPVRVEECDLPDRLRRYHTVNLFEERGFEKLMRALRSRADELRLALTPSSRDELHNGKNHVTLANMENSDIETLVNILQSTASSLHDPKNYYKQLVLKANIPRGWKQQIAYNWSENPEYDARTLIHWAIDKQTNPQDPRYTTLGSILVEVLPQLGLENTLTIIRLIDKYKLSHDHAQLEEIKKNLY